MSETIEHLKQYLQSLIDSGNHKIFYNDLFFDEKTIDCINAINELQQENKQLKEQLEYLRSNEYLNQVKWERNFNEELVKDLQTKIDKAIELIKYTIQHYEELRKKPFADSVFQSDMLRQSFITTIQSFLELLLEDLGDKE